MKNELSDFLKVNDVKYLENESFAKHSPINIGAEAECIVYPQSEKCFVNLKNKYEDVYLCRPVSSGIKIIE